MNLEPGTRLGKYEIVRRIAVGGMAELYLARTTAIGGFEKLVVLKRILPQHADDPAFIEMFLDEARLAATLHHHNIAQVYDIGVDEGAYFFAMEYVHGADLKSISAFAETQATRIPLECAITIAIGALNGLHYAHEKVNQAGESLNLVHRDVSPQNILVSYDGSVKLVDFGIAKAKSSNKQTGTGSLKGKISYMSPEQCTSGDLDRRSDLFAVGTLLWELTTGRRLFDDESDYVQIRKIVEEDARRPSTVVTSYPPALEAIVMKALQRDREARFASAAEIQDALEDFAHENRLRVSSKSLANFMESLFGKKLDEWNAARDKGAFFVEEHVVKTLAGQKRVLASVVAEDETTVRSEIPSKPGTTPDTQVTAAVPMPDAITQVTTPPVPAGKAKPLGFDDVQTDIVKPTPLPFAAPKQEPPRAIAEPPQAIAEPVTESVPALVAEPPVAVAEPPVAVAEPPVAVAEPTPVPAPLTAIPPIAPPVEPAPEAVAAVPAPVDRAATEAVFAPSSSKSNRGLLYAVVAVALGAAAIGLVAFSGSDDDDSDSASSPAVERGAEPADSDDTGRQPTATESESESEPPADEPEAVEATANEPEADEPEADEPEADEPTADEPEPELEPVVAEPEPDTAKKRKKRKKRTRKKTKKRAKAKTAVKKPKKKGKKWNSKSMFLPD